MESAIRSDILREFSSQSTTAALYISVAAYRHLHDSLYRSVNLLAGPRMGCGASNAAPVPGQANTLSTKSVAVRTELVVPDSDTDEELLSATPGQF